MAVAPRKVLSPSLLLELGVPSSSVPIVSEQIVANVVVVQLILEYSLLIVGLHHIFQLF